MKAHILYITTFSFLWMISCRSIDQIKVIDGRPHQIKQEKVGPVVLKEEIKPILTKEEATEKLRQELERKIKEAEARAEIAESEARSVEISWGSRLKIIGSILLGLSIVLHFFVAYPWLRSWGSTGMGLGVGLVCAGVFLKKTASLEDWIWLGIVGVMLMILVPFLIKLKDKGLDKWGASKLKSFLSSKLTK